MSSKKNEVSPVKQKITHSWLRYRSTKFVLHCGPTGSGKTYNAVQAVIKSSGRCCYLSPLRLLAWEVYEKLNEQEIGCSLVTGEERIEQEGDRVVSCTVEMLDVRTKFDIAIIDECFMLQDPSRGKNWLRAIMEIQANEVHLIINEEVQLLVTNLLKCIIDEECIEIKTYTRLVPLVIEKNGYNIDKPLSKTIFVVFSRIDVLYYKSFFEKKGQNVSILYGNLPPEVKKTQMEAFITGKNSVCVATDVIGMGLNLPCEHVVFLKSEKFDGKENRPLNATDVKQIGGRAGRYGISDKGHVWGLNKKVGQFLSQRFNTFVEVRHTFLGLDVDILRLLQEKTLLAKIRAFQKLDIIPDAFKDYVKLQDIQQYTLYYIEELEKLDLELAWTLLNAPIKENSKLYWKTCVQALADDPLARIPCPVNRSIKINDINSLKEAETMFSECELFIYFSHNRLLAEHVDNNEVHAIQILKKLLIDEIDRALLDKKIMKSKKCVDCGCELPVNTHHARCYECYQELLNYNDGY